MRARWLAVSATFELVCRCVEGAVTGFVSGELIGLSLAVSGMARGEDPPTLEVCYHCLFPSADVMDPSNTTATNDTVVLPPACTTSADVSEHYGDTRYLPSFISVYIGTL